MAVNHSFRALYLTLQECECVCVCVGGCVVVVVVTYINALFLTCLACFTLALDECAEDKGLWLF